MAANKYKGLCIFLLLLTGLGLRFYKIASQSLWIDEVYTFMNASGSLSQVILEPQTDYMTPPLYYIIEHFTLQLGNHEAILRLPSVISGSLSILLFYLVLSNWFDGRISILGTIMMVISPFHVWYSQEARAYALLVMLSLLSIYLFQKMIKSPRNPVLAMGFLISTALSFYCHTVALSLIGFIALYVVLNAASEDRMYWLIIFGALLLLVIPGVYSIHGMFSNGEPLTRQSLNPLPLLYSVYAFATGYSLGPTVAQLHMPERVSYVVAYLHIIWPIMVFLLILVLLGLFKLRRFDRSICLFIVLWFVFPSVFIYLSTILGTGSFNVRYAIVSFPAFLIIIAFGIQSVRREWLRVFLFSFVVLISSVSLFNYYFNCSYSRENIKAAGNFLTKQALANDLVIVNAPYAVSGLVHYTKRNDLNIVGYPISEQPVSPSLISSDFRPTINGHSRFWLFLSRTFHSDPKGYIAKYCNAHYRRVYSLQSNGVELVLYGKKEFFASHDW